MRKIKRLLPFILSIMLLSSCGTPGTSKVTYRQISMDEAVKMMKDEKNYIILDVRRPDEYAEGHIPGAINVPNEEIGTTEIAELPDKSQLILVYCRSGKRSKEAAKKLAKLGYTNVAEFGGILDYKGDIEK
ncbi:MAG: rhodanese-like domain-containing protein [Clostridia bacterium]|nr:rhodanese-like domain-containing protein [Clostridia bacterium]MBO7304320.1 rhodanese-like domain-containing protein [Clostridia bacterium]